jgi:hypothetical protein
LLKIDPLACQKIQPYLSSDETLYWAGMPNPKVIFHSDDWVAIPFSLIWTGFIVSWETGVANQHSTFMTLWGIPFLIVGNYMVWGRFLVDACLKRRTYYAVTSQRVLILQNAWRDRFSMTYLNLIPTIEQEGIDRGTLWFGPKLPILGAKGQRKRNISRFSMDDVPVFADIDGVESVRRLILDLRTKANPNPQSGGPLTYS